MSELKPSQVMSDVEKWSKIECVNYLKTVKGAKLSGSKSELIERVQGYIDHPEILEKIRIKPEQTLSTALDIETLFAGHSDIQWNHSHTNLPSIMFNQVEKYLKTKKQGCQALQQKGYRMFASRKIVSVQNTNLNNIQIVKAIVRPSMQTKAARPLWITFVNSCPTQAFCKCPAGKSGLCCHIAATLYALEESTRTGNITLEQAVSCTSKLQTWHKNKPWKGKLSEIKNIKITSAKNKIKKALRKRATAVAVKSSLNSRQSNQPHVDGVQRELRLLHNLNKTGTKSSIWEVLKDRYSSIVDTDHCYSTNTAKHLEVEGEESQEQGCSQQDIINIEISTRGQRINPKWYQYRQFRITSSMARKVLHSTDVGRPALIKKIVNLQSTTQVENIPPPMLYGINNEYQARIRYSELTGQRVEECGSFVSGILLASPDGIIPGLNRVLELKGLANQKNQPVLEAVREKQSLKSYPYTIDDNNKMYLKPENTRGYYEQVQMQMGLSGKKIVDFVVYTDVDLEICSIHYDDAFFQDLKVKLHSWYEKYVQPILSSTQKPKCR